MQRSQRTLLTALALAAIVLLGFSLRVYELDAQSLWYDEAVTAQVVQQGVGELARWTADDIQPPLYYAAVAGWTQAAGLSEAALRLPSAFFGVLMIALAFALGKRLFGPSAGLLAALLAAVQPLWVYYSQEARMYTLLTALGMLAGYALLRVLAAAPAQNSYPKTRLSWWIAFAAASIALLYTHYFAAFLLLAFAVYFLVVVLVHRGPQTARLLLEGVVVALVVALAYLPWLPNALRRFGVDSSYWQGTLKLNEALRHIAISFTTGETVLEGQAIPLAWVVGVIAVVCLVALLVAAFRGRESRNRVESEKSEVGGQRSPETPRPTFGVAFCDPLSARTHRCHSGAVVSDAEVQPALSDAGIAGAGAAAGRRAGIAVQPAAHERGERPCCGSRRARAFWLCC